MFSTLVTLLVLFNQVLLNHLALSAIEHSSERLQGAVGSMCELRKLYDEHKETHGHSRPANEEYGRIKLFLEEIKEILEMRSNKDITWDVGLHFMADMSDTEKASMRGTVSQSNTTAKTLQNSANQEKKLSGFNMPYMPDEFDEWRKNDMVGPIHEQKKSSCWAHAAVVPLEAQLAFYKNTFRQLSVQELYRCTYNDRFRDNGGSPDEAWEYVQKSKRLGYWDDSPEKTDSWFKIPWRDNCKDYQKTPNALAGYESTLSGWATWEGDMRNKIACIGPLTIFLDSTHTKIDKYKGGIFTPIAKNCKETDHVMVAVGYTLRAFIIRNTWGKKWGEDGYLMFDRKGPDCQLFDKVQWVNLEPTDGKEKVCKWDPSLS